MENLKAKRKFLAHFLDTNKLGDPAKIIRDATNYVRLGKDLESYTENLNPDVSTSKNILGENSVVHNGYEVSSDVEPLYVYLDNGAPDALSDPLMYIANNRLTGEGTVTTKVDILIDEDENVIWAYREDVLVVPTSIGGDTSGIQIPFSIHNAGNRTKGTFDLATKTFTPDEAELRTLLIEVAAGSGAGKTKVTDVIGEGSGTLKYKVGNAVTAPAYGDSDTGYTALTTGTDITCTAGNSIVVVESSGGSIVASSAVKKVVAGS